MFCVFAENVCIVTFGEGHARTFGYWSNLEGILIGFRAKAKNVFLSFCTKRIYYYIYILFERSAKIKVAPDRTKRYYSNVLRKT